MAGGIGSRFWPMSTSQFPKQFHDILGTGETLLQQTFRRFTDVCPPENIFIVTNKNYKSLVAEQLPDITDNQILLEPARRNTAPCIAYGTFKIKALNADAKIVVAPSDHIVTNEKKFSYFINTALEASATDDCLITLGIKPTRPDTGYGYIQFNANKTAANTDIKKVKTFTEKPDKEHAKKFIASGDFLWNSGIFIWSAKSLTQALEKHLPDMYSTFKEGEGVYNTNKEQAFINKVYPTSQNESIDYGIMEKAKNVYVLPAEFGWSDLGTWGSLYTHLEHDEHRNAIVGKNVMMYESSGNIVNVSNDKLVVLQGLKNYIVVEKGNTILVCKKDDEQLIKQFVSDVKINKGDGFV